MLPLDKTQIFRYSFRKSIPVLLGYVFLGIAFGILLNREAGLGWPWALLMSVLIYAGSMQFALIPLIASAAPLTTIALMTLLVNARHIFYGLTFVERYRTMGARYPYMVWSLTDETYSVLCSCLDDEAADAHGRLAFFEISLLHHIYWTAGSVLGCVLGGAISMDTTGIDFSMTALFIVILVDQLRSGGRTARRCALAGGASGAVSLFALGAESFLLPALAATVFALVVMDFATPDRGGEAA
ncbi:MAG: branched-chain amino acid transporter AzlC [Clostridiales bacterium]|nr:branched-chain amino acid transporter AzlC [Clostridiales bacterium]